MNYEIAVAGGGVAGLFFAYLTAREGFRVVVIDMKDEERIGEKVCGDAVGEHHFRNVGLEPPRLGVDAISVFEGVKVFSPSREVFVLAKGRGYALDRKAFGRRLLKKAVNAGAEILASHVALKPLVEGSWVRGLLLRGSHGTLTLRCGVLVDATGATAAIRTKLPGSWWISERAPLEDYNAAYRVIAEVEEEQDPRYAMIYLDVEIAPGGYWWWFPKGKYLVNVGLGVKPGPGAPNPKRSLEEHIMPLLEEAGARVLHAGGGLVPTRRPAPCMVGNGMVAVGDAAYTANPLHGGGIGPALLSSYHAAKTVIAALEEGECTLNALWPYHSAYHAAYGAKQAALDVLRIYLQALSNEDIEFVMRRKVLSDEELSEMGYRGELAHSVLSKALSVVGLLRRPSLLRDLFKVKSYMENAKGLFLKFPSPHEFAMWRVEEESLFREVKSRFWM